MKFTLKDYERMVRDVLEKHFQSLNAAHDLAELDALKLQPNQGQQDTTGGDGGSNPVQ